MKRLSGSTLKIIAILTMVIDHIGASLMMEKAFSYGIDMSNIKEILGSHNGYVITYFIFRKIGRISFPIICFLIVEGFLHTRSRLRYAVNLFIFSIVSEIPFDLAFSHRTGDWENQNVFFTLLIGMLTIWIISVAERIFKTQPINTLVFSDYSKVVYLVCIDIMVTCLMMLVAIQFKTDYSYIGVLVIVAMYLLITNTDVIDGATNLSKGHKWAGVLAVGMLFGYSVGEFSAIIAVPLIALYSGKRGLKSKYIFYLVYPLHLLILYFIGRYGMGI